MNSQRRHHAWILALALANAGAAAQSSGVPGPADFASFSRFVTERNIFDPNRYPRSAPGGAGYHAPASRSAPTFTLVGTMHYQKGMFAFFDGNSPDLRKVLYVADTNGIAGYRVAEISLTEVTLQSPVTNKPVVMKIGEMMRQVGNDWQPAGQAELTAGMEAGNAPTPAPPPAGAPNDILKKLMEQRAKELK